MTKVDASSDYVLLGRAPHIEQPPLYLADKTVLVTGAGGSIGSQLCMQLAKVGSRLLVVDMNEYALYKIDKQLRSLGANFEPLLVDIRHEYMVQRLFWEYRPDLVFHAAALKHVPLLENEHNAIEAIRTNVLGTRVVMETARRCPSVRMFIFISTDKAVNPTSWMGATKRCAEKLVFGSSKDVPHMQHIIVRFGNVLGSSGSVVPLFRDQIEKGGPVTITHKKMTRYLMTIPEAVSLVLQASFLGQQQDENFGLYVLDMGEPVLILDIAKRLMRAVGKNVPIEFIGVRPGEKLAEELFYDYESPLPSDVAGVLRASAFLTTTIAQKSIVDLIDKVDRRDYTAAVEVLRRIVPEFCPEKICHEKG